MRTLSHSEVAAMFNCTFSDHGLVMRGGYSEPMYIPWVDAAEIGYTLDDVGVPLFLLEVFGRRILERVRERRQVGLPQRADKFRAALCIERNRTRMLMSDG